MRFGDSVSVPSGLSPLRAWAKPPGIAGPAWGRGPPERVRGGPAPDGPRLFSMGGGRGQSGPDHAERGMRRGQS